MSVSGYGFRGRALSCAAALVVALALILAGAAHALAQEAMKRETLVLVTASGEHSFDVEIAATAPQQARGLMFRRALAANQGMLFVYDEPQYVSMWMRNTYIPLDMVFIRADGRVHRIEPSAEPLSERVIGSGEKVGAVLELPGGTAARLGLKPGDTVRHPHFKRPGG